MGAVDHLPLSASRTVSYAPASSAIVRGVAVALGLVLVVAAGLKLYGLNVSPLPGIGWLSVPGVQMAVVAAELLVGFWLLSGTAKPYAWLAALGLFSAFAIVSGYLGFIGQASCGCFGTIEASHGPRSRSTSWP